MKPLEVQPPFIAFSVPLKDYEKIKGLLPTPTHRHRTHGYNPSMEVCYEISHFISKPKMLQWLGSIKLTIAKNILHVKLEDEFYISENTHSSGAKYHIYELSKLFKVEFIKYPRGLYPANKKELYQNLVKYAKKLLRADLLVYEVIFALSLKFNEALPLMDRYSLRELSKKSKKALEFTKEHKEEMDAKRGDELKKCLINGGKMRGEQRQQAKEDNIQRIKEMIPLHVKPNGKPNITAISKELKLRRETISRLIKTLLVIWLIWLPFTSEMNFTCTDKKTQIVSKCINADFSIANLSLITNTYHNANS